MKIAAIIPARYASTRFPGKPLVDIGGKTMIQRVYERASQVIEDVCVATDDTRIFDHVKMWKGMVVMTSAEHQSGTDRCAEAIEKLKEITQRNYDIVINIQGDEPFIEPAQIEQLINCFRDETNTIATLVKPVTSTSEIENPNLPKVVFTNQMKAIYFSRSPIPFVRGTEPDRWIQVHQFYRHIGMYGYRTEALKEITKLKPGRLELAESLEQNRWIENGYSIGIGITEFETFGIDTPEDLENLRKRGVF